MRPYNHPDNVGQNGKPKMSEDAWAISENLREESLEDTSWGSQLLAKVDSKVDIATLMQVLAALPQPITLSDLQPVLGFLAGLQAAFGSPQNLIAALTGLSAKVDQLRTDVDTLLP